MRKALRLVGTVLAAAIGIGGATAQTYPAKPVTIVVPFAPGGGSDAMGRLIAQKLAEKTGQSFIVENKGGAGTNIGNEFVSRAAPDGYTLLLAQVTLGINPALYPTLPYKVQDFVPVGMIARSPTVLVVKADHPARTLAEFTKGAKDKPGSVNFASGGNGTSVHLAGELFKLQTGTQMQHVGYRGSAPAMNDLLGGTVQVMFDTAPSAIPQVKGGRLRALAVTGAKRFPELPDVPTFTEAGMAGFDVPVWYGLAAPKGTPDAAVATLNGHMNAILAEPEMQDRLVKLGAEPAPITPAAMRAFIDAEIAKWAKVIGDAGVKLE